MDLSNNTIERICKIFGHLDALEKRGVDFVSSKELAGEIGATEYTIRKDISLLGGPGYTRKGYEVKSFKKELGEKFLLTKRRKACIVGLGRLGTALLDYENFQEDGFEIVAGFDCSVNKIERIRTSIDVFAVSRLEEIVEARDIELGIVAVPAESAQEVVDLLTKAGVKGILNFSPVKVNIPTHIVHLDMDFTNALRFIAARFIMKKT
ncbi:MAG: redox-sensing transcriptional repressor Rex [Candidatus Omnitrophica bacterium]|nr:redox-sensing transcriptional repressor Rex [Candidatus Omnitrophota bacterium]